MKNNIKPKILIAFAFDEDCLSKINEVFDISYKPDISNKELFETIKNYNAILIGTFPQLNEDLLSQATNLSLIIRMGIGIDHIDLKYCKNHSINVCITPKANILPVVELVFGQMIQHTRKLSHGSQNLYKGNFRKDLSLGDELQSKTIGIIGTGRIGSKICDISSFFDMKILAYDPYITDKSIIQANFVSLETLIRESDIISLHVPLTEETDNLVDENFLSLMKPKSILINTSRGRVAPMKTLIEFAKKDIIETFIIDVYDKEPFIPNINDLEILKKYFSLTPHIGAHSHQSKHNRSIEAIEELFEYFIDSISPHGLIDLDKGY